MRRGVLIVYDEAGKPKVRLGPEVDVNDQLVAFRAMLTEPPKGVAVAEMWTNSEGMVRRQMFSAGGPVPAAPVSEAAAAAAADAKGLTGRVEAAVEELKEARQAATVGEPDAAVMGRVSAAEHGLEKARAALSQWQQQNALRVVADNEKRHQAKLDLAAPTNKRPAAAKEPAAAAPDKEGPAAADEATEMSWTG